MKKIDPSLLSSTYIQGENKEVECVVYAFNFDVARSFLMRAGYEVLEYPFIHAFGMKVPVSKLQDIASFNAVQYITTNSKVSALMDISRDVMHIDSTKMWQNYSFTCAVIDTGFQPHIDMSFPKNQIVHFVDLVNGKKKAYDDNGHGTFVAGVIAGKGIASGGRYKGVASGMNLIPIKALDEKGEAGAFNILKAMQWVYDHRKKYNIKVVCMSFGSVPLGRKDPLIMGAEVLWDSGVTVVCAAGNSGPESETIRSPGASTKIITVGAMDDHRLKEDFSVAEFSSRGPIYGNYKPDVVAPGVNIVGACNYKMKKKFYAKMSGTSVATPMVVGVCCEMLRLKNSLSPNQIKSILMETCDPINYSRNDEGRGIINFEKILKT